MLPPMPLLLSSGRHAWVLDGDSGPSPPVSPPLPTPEPGRCPDATHLQSASEFQDKVNEIPLRHDAPCACLANSIPNALALRGGPRLFRKTACYATVGTPTEGLCGVLGLGNGPDRSTGLTMRVAVSLWDAYASIFGLFGACSNPFQPFGSCIDTFWGQSIPKPSQAVMWGYKYGHRQGRELGTGKGHVENWLAGGGGGVWERGSRDRPVLRG